MNTSAESTAGAYFVADQREVPVTDLKAGNWVYLADRCAWMQLTHNPRRGYTIIPMNSKAWESGVRLDFEAIPPQFFRVGAVLWVRRTEEGD